MCFVFFLNPSSRARSIGQATAVFKFPELSMYWMVLFAMMQENKYAKMINNMAYIENKRSEQTREHGISFHQYGIIRLTNFHNLTLPNFAAVLSLGVN